MKFNNSLVPRIVLVVVSMVTLIMVTIVAPSYATAQDDALQQAKHADKKRVEVIAKARAASICVFSTDGNGGGSGVIVTADGLALTNHHVVKPCGTHMHCSMPDGRIYDAVLVGIDPTGDVAMIKLLGPDDFPIADWGDSDELRVGESCFAIGNPFLLATNFEPSVSWGIVSGVHRYQYPAGTLLEYTDCIQTDAAINPGNSGGPLFNERGQLVGINGRGSFEKRGRVNVGVGYAISINQVRLFWDHLRSGRIVDHATLGAIVTTDAEGRVVVDDILGSSDAYRRGLRYDDQIVSFGGRSIETVNEFKNVLGIYPKGWRVPLEYQRDGVLYRCRVRLEGLHSPDELVQKTQGLPRSSDNPERPKPKNPPAGSKAKVPIKAARLIEERYGYANYFFNQQFQNKIWNGSKRFGDTTSLPKKWKVTGQLSDGRPVKFALDGVNAGIQWDEAATVLDADIDLAAQRVPDGSGGLLVTAHLLHRWLTEGPDSFGEVFYLGALPDAAEGENAAINTGGTTERQSTEGQSTAIRDVLVARFESVEARFLFDKMTHRLVAMEVWTDPDLDPCEIQFSEFRSVDGGTQAGTELPHLWSIRYADESPWQLSITNFDFAERNIDDREADK